MKTRKELRIEKILKLHGYGTIEELIEAANNGTLSQTNEFICLNQFTTDHEIIRQFGPLTARLVRRKDQIKEVRDDQYNSGPPEWEKAITSKQVIEMSFGKGLISPHKIVIDLKKKLVEATFSRNEREEEIQAIEQHLKSVLPNQRFLRKVA